MGVQFGPSRTMSHSKIKSGLNVAAPVCEQNVISAPMMHFKYLDLKMDIGIEMSSAVFIILATC